MPRPPATPRVRCSDGSRSWRCRSGSSRSSPIAGLLAIPVLWETMHDYQQKRIVGFIDCGIAPTKECWHTQQSIYAVGSGKLWGKGFLEGTQNQFNFVPEHWTDF